MTDPTGAQSGAGEGAQSGIGATGAGDGQQQTNQGTGAQSGTSDGQQGQAQSGKTYSEAEFQALMQRMQAADRRASEFEQQYKQLRDKDLPEMDKLKRDYAETKEQLEKANTALNALRIENAFLTSNSHEWHNAADALALLDRSKIAVDSEGNVTGMKEAIEALAKARPYLLKPKAEGAAGGTGATPPPPTVVPANGGIGGQATGQTVAEKARRFPAMRSRMG